MPQMDVLDRDLITRTINTIPNNGRAAEAASQPITLSTEDKAKIDAIAASCASIDSKLT